jgi:MoxR-like ATPase
MEERQVTLEGKRQPLPYPFFVVATQNPVEYEGTYPLPEAQLDRFLFKLLVDYPPSAAERQVLRNYDHGFDANALDTAGMKPILSPDSLREVQEEIRAVTVDDSILEYITSISEATRRSADLMLGASPRASVALLLSAKTLAAVRGRSYVIPDDVKELTPPAFRHRIVLRPEAEIEGLTPDRVIERILVGVPVPR